MPLYPNQMVHDILVSGEYNGTFHLERPRGSFYLQMKDYFDYYLEHHSNWNWLVNFRTKEIFQASDFEVYSRR